MENIDRTLLQAHTNGLGVRVLDGACGLLWRSCGNTELSRCDADDPLEVKGNWL